MPQNRKDQHVSLANQQYQTASSPDFEQTRFVHHSLPQMDVTDVDLSTQVAGLELFFPFFVNAITGGSEKTGEINRRFGILARETGIVVASGSVSAAIKDPSVADTFRVLRKENPTGVLLANLGAHHNVENAKRAVDLLEANALQLHINAPQEIVMPEGDRTFSSWLKNIESIVAGLEVPVIVKEVGFGMSRETLHQLASVGVRTVDVSGTGGTDFARIENGRRPGRTLDFLNGWGQSTVTSLIEAQHSKTEIEVIASGGIKNALDIVKSLALGAKAVGLSNHFLQLVKSEATFDQAVEEVFAFKEEIAMVMTLLGKRTIQELNTTDLILAPSVQNWCQARGIDWTAYAKRFNNSFY